MKKSYWCILSLLAYGAAALAQTTNPAMQKPTSDFWNDASGALPNGQNDQGKSIGRSSSVGVGGYPISRQIEVHGSTASANVGFAVRNTGAATGNDSGYWIYDNTSTEVAFFKSYSGATIIGSPAKNVQVGSYLASGTLSLMAGGASRATISSAGYWGFGVAPSVNRYTFQGSTSSVAASSGSAENGTVRIGNNLHSSVVDFGSVSGSTWQQSRNSTNYASPSTHSINPTGGNVGVYLVPAPTSALQVGGSIACPSTNTSVSLTLTIAHCGVTVSNAAVAVTIILPAASASPGRMYSVCRGDASTGVVTIAAASGTLQTLAGALASSTTLAALGAYGQCAQYQAEGTVWRNRR